MAPPLARRGARLISWPNRRCTAVRAHRGGGHGVATTCTTQLPQSSSISLLVPRPPHLPYRNARVARATHSLCTLLPPKQGEAFELGWGHNIADTDARGASGDQRRPAHTVRRQIMWVFLLPGWVRGARRGRPGPFFEAPSELPKGTPGHAPGHSLLHVATTWSPLHCNFIGVADGREGGATRGVDETIATHPASTTIIAKRDVVYRTLHTHERGCTSATW